MKQSPLFSLNWHDVLKGFIMAVGGAVWGLLAPISENWINNKPAIIDYTAIWHTAVAAAGVYIAKQILTPAAPTKEVTKDTDGTVTKTVISTDSVDVKVK